MSANDSTGITPAEGALIPDTEITPETESNASKKIDSISSIRTGRSTAPKSFRAKFVLFIWRSIPRLFLVGMIALIVMLLGTINEKKQKLEIEKAEAKTPEKPLVNTVVMPLEPGIIRDRINLPGSMEPWTTLDLKAEVGGIVEQILVREGQELRKGEIILHIEKDDYRIAIDRAEAAYKLAVAEFKRDKAVHLKGIISEAQLDITETNMQLAKANLDDARLMLERTTIKSPMSGVVNRIDAEVGLLLSTGDPVGQILRIDKLKAVVGIPESDMPAVAPLSHVDISVQALDDRKITGEKFFLSSSPDTAALLYRLELTVDNPDRDIMPGMFVRADVVKKERKNVIIIPFYSVISRNNEQFVFVEKDGVAVKRLVSLGIMEKWMVEAKTGLNAGEQLIVEGHRDIEDGQKIKVVHTLTESGEYSL
ncbi:putative Efflux transporter, RND family, MFP subunit [Desulfamplus magnetovallimortis]|uniref:Putative Efflux transporter, RND family, MFP subunit n=1 Tax=Desulfamplus magnetovallimortis TaxID=1246637 RepID=A0A1W1HGE8_9BACT|nr:efflux RND transporter periplasmic adaptor subunit [Desulfamplus magnetovallimortis]SLM31516.1 putative Efflux transporter, RND family, MFP subunit [Desulfamplus magnetovallimortis]